MLTRKASNFVDRFHDFPRVFIFSKSSNKADNEAIVCVSNSINKDTIAEI